MNTIRTKQHLRSAIKTFRTECSDGSIGLVPTMGYLHEGHMSMIHAARSENDFVIVSLFVNPMQFGENEDFDRYPHDELLDQELCETAGVDILFAPDKSTIYPVNHSTYVFVKDLSEPLCGEFRPDHFKGVTTIVTKLFLLTAPDRAYFGQKDGQQALVIRRMTLDLNFNVDIKILPTIRESDGLAMSSRNVNLSPFARNIASTLYKALSSAQELVQKGERNISKIIESAKSIIESVPEITIQYLECRDCEQLQELHTLDRPGMLAVAAFIESIRLIDNIILYPFEETSDEA